MPLAGARDGRERLARLRSSGSARSFACSRTSSFARWKPKISTRVRRSASRPSAIRCRGSPAGCGRSARGRRGSRRPSGSRPARRPASRPAGARRRRACAGTARPRSGRRSRPCSRRAPARRGRWTRVSSGSTGTSEPRRRTNSPRAAAPRRGGAASASARARSSAAAIVSGPAAGLPSWSPPIHDPKRSGVPAPGSRRRRSRRARSPRRAGSLEEPEAVADLVDDARAARAHLVGLPERRHLLGDRVLDPVAAGRGEIRVVELAQEPAHPQVGGEDRAARRLGRVRGEDELERAAGDRTGQARRRRRRPRPARRTPRPATRAEVLPSCSYWRRRRRRWCCSARLASWK